MISCRTVAIFRSQDHEIIRSSDLAISLPHSDDFVVPAQEKAAARDGGRGDEMRLDRVPREDVGLTACAKDDRLAGLAHQVDLAVTRDW